MIGQRDAVGLVTVDGEARGLIPPRSAPGHFSVLCKALEETEAGGEAPLSGLLHALAERARRRGLVVVLSDGFEPLDALTAALRHLRHRRHEVLFLHVLAPEEEEFPFGARRGSATWRPATGPPRRSRGAPRGLPGAVPGLLPGLARAPGRMEADYHQASTAEAPSGRCWTTWRRDRGGGRGGEEAHDLGGAQRRDARRAARRGHPVDRPSLEPPT